MPFVAALVPEVDVAGRPGGHRPAGGLFDLDDVVSAGALRHRRRHDLPGLPRAARPVAHRQGRASRACSTCGSTTCATSPTTGTAPSTTRRTAAAPAWSCAPSRGARRWTHVLADGAPATGGDRAASAPDRPRRPAGVPFTPGDGARAGRASRGSPSPAGATRASTSACTTRPRADAGLASSSLGDYVLNGGEVAVLAMVEAVARLLPGVIGNAESLVEESHEDGLLEYPVYTKPPVWRGRGRPGGAPLGPPRRDRALAARRAAAAYGPAPAGPARPARPGAPRRARP